MRDMALNLFWANRFKITMYDVRPTRWADVPRRRDDLFVPILTPWKDRDTKVSAVQSAYPNLPAQWNAEVEDSVFEVLFDVFGHRRNHATKLSAVVPTVADLLADPANQTLRLNRYDPDFPMYSYTEIIDCNEEVAELEALRRWSMVLHNQYPWDRSEATLVPVSELRRRRLRGGVPSARRRGAALPVARRVRARRRRRPARRSPRCTHPSARTRRSTCATTSRCTRASRPSPRCTASLVCTNEDLIRNSAYNWSPMSAEEIAAKTGIEARRYTSGSLEELSLRAARAAMAHAQVGPEQIGAVFVCTCTSSRLIPSVGDLAVGPVRHPADARLVRPGRRLRRPELRAGRGHQSAATGAAPGAGGLRGKVLRQDRQRPPIPDDLRRRRGRHHRGRRPRRVTPSEPSARRTANTTLPRRVGLEPALPSPRVKGKRTSRSSGTRLPRPGRF